MSKPWVCVCSHNRSWHSVGNPFRPQVESCQLCAVCSRTAREHGGDHRFQRCRCGQEGVA